MGGRHVTVYPGSQSSSVAELASVSRALPGTTNVSGENPLTPSEQLINKPGLVTHEFVLDWGFSKHVWRQWEDVVCLRE